MHESNIINLLVSFPPFRVAFEFAQLYYRIELTPLLSAQFIAGNLHGIRIHVRGGGGRIFNFARIYY